MALNIPNVGTNLDALMKGISTGSNLFHNIMLNKYYGQLHPSGDVANAMYVEQLRNQYGDQDPRYLEAKRAHDLVLSGRQSLIDYRDVLNQTAGPRYSSTLGKTIMEGKGQGAADILNRNRGSQGAPAGAVSREGDQYYDAQGNPVYDDNPRTPEEREAYERAIAKQTGDAEARNTYLRAQNLDKTRNAIKVDDLTRFSGLKGTGKYLFESAKAAAGNPSDEYLAHQQAVNSASLMADQMRQFYKDSIQPSAMERLRELSNPSTWYKDPKVAKAQWEQLNKILDQETETYRKAGTSPVKLNKIDFKNGKFLVNKNQMAAETEQGMQSAETQNEDDELLASYADQLTQIDPEFTPENIKHTAKEEGKSVGQIITELLGGG